MALATQEEIDEQEKDLTPEKEIVVEQVQGHQGQKDPSAALMDRLIQGPEHVGEKGRHIQKVVEKDVVHSKAGEPVQHAPHHGHVPVLQIPAHPEVGAAAGQPDLKAEHGGHGVGHQRLGQKQGEPPERRACQIEGVAVQKAAAQVGLPAEGAAPLLYKTVGIVVEGDLLGIEVPCIEEDPFIHDHAGQQKTGCRQKAKPEGELVLVLFFQGRCHDDSFLPPVRRALSHKRRICYTEAGAIPAGFFAPSILPQK